MHVPSIYALGDVHAKSAYLLDFLNNTNPDIVLQTGDFGLSTNPSADSYSVQYLEKRLCALPVVPTIYWCDGNHEQWNELARLLLSVSPDQRQHGIPLTEHIIWMPRGSWMALPDGRIVRFVGGAKSVDWQIRLKQGLPWAGLQEQLHPDDLCSAQPAADIVISHTAPRSFCLPGIDDLAPDKLARMTLKTGWDLTPDPSRDVLETLYEQNPPARWLCGHFHRFIDAHLGNTHFAALDCLTGTGQRWMRL